jgi:site-specific DNA recombinase
MKTAVLYLRVSTTGQVETDYDPEGISIPAQRKACERKAEQMGAMVVDEYVEPGRSATTIEKRPVFQQMMERIKRERDVDYVIVYNLSRLNRNRVDDARVLMAMRAVKVTLVSAQENIDETPAGQLMHGILAAFNEYRSSADGADIRYKMSQKARNGGTLGRAPIGYLNIRDRYEGREIRTVAIDEERAPYIRLAFELYATGEYSIGRLCQTLTDRGLRTRGDARFPAGPIAISKLAVVLRNPYYTGKVVYGGAIYEGRHPALITPELFDRVQAVIDGHASAGVRQRKHHHYLKGTLWCGRCELRGTSNRLTIQRAMGNGGEYWYFFCLGRQDGVCDAPYVRVEALEELVLRHWAGLVLPEGFAARVRAKLDETLADEERGSRLLQESISTRLAALDVQEENLLDLAVDATIPKDKLRSRLIKLGDEREQLRRELDGLDTRLSVGAAVIRAALDLLATPQLLYRKAGERERRLLNQAIFARIYVDGDTVTDERLNEPFDELLYFRRGPRAVYQRTGAGRRRGALAGASRVEHELKVGLLETALAGGGSSRAAMVDVAGLEPATSRV